MAIIVQAQPGVESRPIGTPYQSAQGATLDVFGGAQAEGLIRAGARLGQGADQLAAIAVKNQLEDNERYSKDMDNMLSERIRLITLGDGTAQNPGYYSTNGENAVAAFQPTAEAIKKARDDILNNAPNDRVREIFRVASDDRLNTEFGKLTVHQNDGRRTATIATSKVRQNEAIQNAAAHWNDDKVVAKSLGIAQSEVQAQARLEGWSDEVTVSQMQAAVSGVYAAQITAAMKADPDAALALFDKVKGNIDGDVRLKLEGMLEDVTIAYQSQENAAKFIAEAGGDYSKAMRLAEAELSGKQEDAAVERIKVKQSQAREDIRFSWAVQSHAEQQEAKSLKQFGLDEANNIIAATGDISRAEAIAAAETQGYDAKQLEAVTAAINAHYIPIENEEQRQRAIASSTAQEISRQEAAADKAAQEYSNTAIESFRSWVNDGGNSLDWQRQNPELYAEARKRSDFDDVKKVEKWNLQDAATQTDWNYFDQVMHLGNEEYAKYGLLEEARTKLAPNQFSQLQARVVAATDPDKKDAGSVATLQQEIDAAINSMGLVGKDKAKQRGTLQSMINEEISRAEEANGDKRLNSEERRKIIASVTDPISIQRSGWFGIDRLAPDVEGRPFEQNVPEEYRAAIVSAYKKHNNGQEPSQAEIARAYLKMKGAE